MCGPLYSSCIVSHRIIKRIQRFYLVFLKMNGISNSQKVINVEVVQKPARSEIIFLILLNLIYNFYKRRSQHILITQIFFLL